MHSGPLSMEGPLSLYFPHIFHAYLTSVFLTVLSLFLLPISSISEPVVGLWHYYMTHQEPLCSCTSRPKKDVAFLSQSCLCTESEKEGLVILNVERVWEENWAMDNCHLDGTLQIKRTSKWVYLTLLDEAIVQ